MPPIEDLHDSNSDGFWPSSGRSEPRPVPDPEGFAHVMRVFGLPSGVQVTCTCKENGKPWARTLGQGHSIPDLVRFAAMHDGGPGQPGKNEGEPDGLTGPGPVTDFSSPSSPPAEQCFGCSSTEGPFTGVAELLPGGGFGTEHLYCRDIAPCNDRRDAQLLSFGSAMPRPTGAAGSAAVTARDATTPDGSVSPATAPFGSESEPQS